MTPNDFVKKWRFGRHERRDWHSFFNDVCTLVGHDTPRDADPTHTWFTHEHGASKANGGQGWSRLGNGPTYNAESCFETKNLFDLNALRTK